VEQPYKTNGFEWNNPFATNVPEIFLVR